MKEPKIGQIYRMFESETAQYKIILLAQDIDSPKKYVILKQLFDSPTYKQGTFWAIELGSFFSKQVLEEDQFIAENKYSKGAEIPRFVLIGDFLGSWRE
jgi:hypothetical protein